MNIFCIDSTTLDRKLRDFIERGLEVSRFQGLSHTATNGVQYIALSVSGDDIVSALFHFLDKAIPLKEGKGWMEWRVFPEVRWDNKNEESSDGEKVTIYARFALV